MHWFKLSEFEGYNIHKTTYVPALYRFGFFFFFPPFPYKSGLVWLLPVKKNADVQKNPKLRTKTTN